MDNAMASGIFRLKGPQLLKLAKGVDNAHQASLRGSVSWPTASRYINTPQKVRVLDLEVFTNLVIDGFGLTPDEVLNLRMGDLFEYADRESETE
jgi:hypothetical protein